MVDDFTPESAEALSQDLLTRVDLMLTALRQYGVDPFADPRNYMAIQLMGPVLLALQDANLEEGTQHMLEIVRSLDLDVLRSKWIAS